MESQRIYGKRKEERDLIVQPLNIFLDGADELDLVFLNGSMDLMYHLALQR